MIHVTQTELRATGITVTCWCGWRAAATSERHAATLRAEHEATMKETQ